MVIFVLSTPKNIEIHVNLDFPLKLKLHLVHIQLLRPKKHGNKGSISEITINFFCVPVLLLDMDVDMTRTQTIIV